MVIKGRLLKYNTVLPDGNVLLPRSCELNDGKAILIFSSEESSPYKIFDNPLGICKLRCEDDGVYFTFYPNDNLDFNKREWFLNKKKFYISPRCVIMKRHEKSFNAIKKASILYGWWSKGTFSGGYVNEVEE